MSSLGPGLRCLCLAATLLSVELLCGCSAAGTAALPEQRPAIAGPVRPADTADAQLWLIPSGQSGLMMHAHLSRPPGEGPFPLAVISHGSEQDVSARAHMHMSAYPALTNWLLARGYAVLLPQRLGHGETGGPYLEDQGSCADADFVRSGNAVADSIASSISFMFTQNFIRKTGVIVVGNSAGGWGSIALAARNPRGVAAIVNFAGGRGGHNRNQPYQNCAPERLVAAAGVFGRTAREPTLWLYAQNDTYFAPSLSRRMADAFQSAGGKVTFELLPPIGREGHGLIEQAPPGAPWIAPLSAFLASVR